MSASQSQQDIIWEEAKIEIYNDVSKRTTERRKLLHPITKGLRERGISYRWGFPMALRALTAKAVLL